MPVSKLSSLNADSNGNASKQVPLGVSSPPAPPTAAGPNKLLGIAKRHALVILGVAVTYFSYSALKTFRRITLYEGSFQILVEPVNADNANLATPDNTDSRRSTALDYPTQIAILKSPELLESVAADLRPTYRLGYGGLVNQIEINRLGSTKMLMVSYSSARADEAIAVLNALAQEYLDYSQSERQTNIQQGLKFVENQISELSEEQNGLQNRLEGFQQQNNFVDPQTRSEQLTSRMASLEVTEKELEQSLASTKIRREVLQEDDGMQVTLEQDGSYQQLRNQIQAIDAQIALELTRFRPDNPAIRTLEKQRENLLPLLEQQAGQFLDTRLAEVDIEQSAIAAQLNAIRLEQAELNNQIRTLPTLNREYGNIQKQLEITSNRLTSFLETRQSLQVKAAQEEITWEIVREPSVGPIASDSTKSLFTGLLTGLALGLAVAFALDKLDKTYHTPEELKQNVRLPVLGVLPFNQELFLNSSDGMQRKKRKLLSRLRAFAITVSAKFSKSMSALALTLLDEYDSSSEFVEALRVMHVNLQLSRSAPAAKIITISSASVGDGKSTVALNWAQTAVEMGQSVLLIDAVLHDPQLHYALNVPNELGLSDLLTQSAGLDDGLQQVRSDGKLYAITAGSAVENPAGLLNSPRLQKLLMSYRKYFDLVIIDTPSLAGLADATIVNRHADGLVLVVKIDQTDKQTLQDTLESLESLDASVLGMVINGHKGRTSTLREAYLNIEDSADSSEDAELPLVAIATTEDLTTTTTDELANRKLDPTPLSPREKGWG
ncbi:MAG: polysaccharide biosynthesis tyrosine autokinase [Cyanobacteria bacterium J06634_6]